MNDRVDPGQFVDVVERGGVKLLFLGSCNSLRVFSRVRASSLRGLVAATEDLEINYALGFESSFYRALSLGSYVSDAFRHAATSLDQRSNFVTRSDSYDPMFLDLKEDFAFGEGDHQPGVRGG
jgi:hypothetical protein